MKSQTPLHMLFVHAFSSGKLGLYHMLKIYLYNMQQNCEFCLINPFLSTELHTLTFNPFLYIYSFKHIKKKKKKAIGKHCGKR